MVNITEFTSRLKKVMEFHQLSASMFADKVGVQRSSISHILSGRNKPSLDFVMKILKAFPEVELYWLLNGAGTFPKKKNQTIEKSYPTPEIETVSQKTEQPNLENNEVIQNSIQKNDIERIVVFYKDGTFKNYIP